MSDGRGRAQRSGTDSFRRYPQHCRDGVRGCLIPSPSHVRKGTYRLPPRRGCDARGRPLAPSATANVFDLNEFPTRRIGDCGACTQAPLLPLHAATAAWRRAELSATIQYERSLVLIRNSTFSTAATLQLCSRRTPPTSLRFWKRMAWRFTSMGVGRLMPYSESRRDLTMTSISRCRTRRYRAFAPYSPREAFA